MLSKQIRKMNKYSMRKLIRPWEALREAFKGGYLDTSIAREKHVSSKF